MIVVIKYKGNEVQRTTEWSKVTLISSTADVFTKLRLIRMISDIDQKNK